MRVTAYIDTFRGPSEDTDKGQNLDDCEEELVERVYSLDFERKTQNIHFVRGSKQSITWDGCHNHTGDVGIEYTKRGNINVERFYKIIGGDHLGMSGSEMRINPEVVEVAEVTTANVTYREKVKSEDMRVVAVGQHRKYIDPETGETVTMSRFPEPDKIEYFIKEGVE